MSAGTLNITIEQGALFEMVVTINDGQPSPQPVDLTGYAFEGQVRKTHNDKTISASFDFEILDQTQPATKGKVRAFIPSAETALIQIKGEVPGVRETSPFLYDISYGPIGGEKYRLLQGAASVVGEVTK